MSHTHVGTVHWGWSATCGTAGGKTYYTCTCGKAFEEETCTTEIENLNTWKVIPATGEHTYDNACDATCNVCGATRTPADHVWVTADCTTGMTCSVCGRVNSASLGHIGGEATCTAKAVCTRCGLEYGEFAPHTGGTATCLAKAVCTVCNNEYGELAAHTGGTATCIAKAKCTVCEQEYGELAAHTGGTATCGHKAVCTVCEQEYGETPDHTWVNATCSAPKTCSVCGETEGEALPHTWVNATCTTPKTCSVCNTTEGEALGHTLVAATCTTPEYCSVCNVVTSAELGHTYPNTYNKDDNKHWHECSVCHDKKDEAAHSYSNSGVCVCGTAAVISIAVNGGSGSMSGITVAEGKVTLPACEYTAPEGKEFDGYMVNGVKYNAGDKVDYAEGMTVTVVWKDKTADTPNNPNQPNQPDNPNQPDGGLSGGAIAGIVIGSIFGVIIVGCGAFALVWFVVKKKTFAELVTLVKGIFVKKSPDGAPVESAVDGGTDGAPEAETSQPETPEDKKD